MSKRYTQLTEAERYHIYTMKKQGYTDTVIAQGMGRDRTTIWRELQRNTGQRGYRHQQAQHWAVARHRTKPKQVKLTPEVQAEPPREFRRPVSLYMDSSIHATIHVLE